MNERSRETCVVLKPVAFPSWRDVCAVSVVGFYAMPGLDKANVSEYLRRIGQSAQSLLEFVRKDVAGGARLKWETHERTMQQMLEMGVKVDLESAWAVVVGVNVEFPPGKADGDVAQSFGNAWIPRFSSVMQFHVPFDDAPNLPIADGDPNFALLLQR